MLCFSTQIKVGTLCVKDHQVIRLEHRLGLNEIPKKHKKKYFYFKKIEEKPKKNCFFCVGKIYIRGHLISRI